MDLLIAFIVFLAVMLGALATGMSMVYGLIAGLVAFIVVGLRRHYKFKELCKMCVDGNRESWIVIEVMCVIGFLTAVWRVSGTITIFVYYGMKIITPSLFLIIAFLLACLLSYALGTSFGVAGTVGVIFMTLARSGGVDPLITAGVLMSGVNFGDRCSPVSSSATLVAGVTGTNIIDNVKMMMKTGLIPLILCIVIYSVFSVRNPITQVDPQLMVAFENEFNLSAWAFVPAILMLILPLLKVSVLRSMAVSIVTGIFVAWLVQGVPLLEVLKICIVGFEATGDGLGSLLNGGGLVSMIEIVVILIISCAFSGIFNGTKMLETLQDRLHKGCTKIGRFSMMLIISIGSAAVFCNQTIATLMCNDLLGKPYKDGGGSKQELAIDMENSVILIACSIPWSIGCSVPLAFFGVDFHAMPYAVYMYAMPIIYWFTKRKWYSETTYIDESLS